MNSQLYHSSTSNLNKITSTCQPKILVLSLWRSLFVQVSCPLIPFTFSVISLCFLSSLESVADRQSRGSSVIGFWTLLKSRIRQTRKQSLTKGTVVGQRFRGNDLVKRWTDAFTNSRNPENHTKEPRRHFRPQRLSTVQVQTDPTIYSQWNN